MSIDTFSMRDHLLLAFAEAASYGVAARPAVDAEVTGAALAAELRARHPGGLGSFVFWTERDDARFDADGELTAGLPLHCSGEEVVAAVREACAHQGVDVTPGKDRHVLMAGARVAQPG